MILTKILRGMSLGTTLRDPLGKSVVTIVLRRLWKESRRCWGFLWQIYKTLQNNETWCSSTISYANVYLYFDSFIWSQQQIINTYNDFAVFHLIHHNLPLRCSVALTLDSDHVNPQQSIKRFKCNAGHFRISTLWRDYIRNCCIKRCDKRVKTLNRLRK